MKMKHTVFIAVVVALALTSLLIRAVTARVTDFPMSAPGTIANFRMSNSPYGPLVTRFPVGTSVVYVCFDYYDLQGDEIRIRVDDGLDEEGKVINLYDRTASYTGSGTESLEVPYEDGGFTPGAYNTVLERGGLLADSQIWHVNYMVFLPLILRNYP